MRIDDGPTNLGICFRGEVAEFSHTSRLPQLFLQRSLRVLQPIIRSESASSSAHTLPQESCLRPPTKDRKALMEVLWARQIQAEIHELLQRVVLRISTGWSPILVANRQIRGACLLQPRAITLKSNGPDGWEAATDSIPRATNLNMPNHPP